MKSGGVRCEGEDLENLKGREDEDEKMWMERGDERWREVIGDRR